MLKYEHLICQLKDAPGLSSRQLCCSIFNEIAISILGGTEV
jgi:hypothetical protein